MTAGAAGARRLTRPGATVCYRREGTGPAVLLVQGAGVVGEGWRPQIDALRDRFTVVSLDNRGIGGSVLDAGGGAGRLSIEDMAADALAVVDAEGIDRFHLGGHSMGGLIAQHIALAAPHRVTSLALLCTFARGAQAARLSLGMIATALRMRIGTPRMRRNAFLELVMPASYLRTVDRARLASELQSLFGHDLARQPAFVMQQLRAMTAFDASDRLPSLPAMPTLVVSATHDRIARPAYGRELAAAIRGARFVEIGEAGHAVTIQCAGRVNALLDEHLGAAERAGAAASQAG